MKRWIALVLIALLLAMPLTGLAEDEQPESVCLTISMAVDEEGFYKAMMQLLEAEGFHEVDEQLQESMLSVYKANAQLYNAMEVTAQLQANGLRVAMLLQGVEWFSAEIVWTENEISMASSLIPGYRLTYSIQALREAVEQVDWGTLLDDLADELDTWLAAQDVSTESGSFAGNAYEGGTARTTYNLEDGDLATLLDGFVLRLETRQDVVNLLNALANEDGGAADFFHEIRTMNHQVALNSTYRYTLAVVRNGESADVGYSLNVFEGDTLLGSLSLGVGTDALLGVVSVPVGDTVAYVDLHLAENGFSFSARQAAADTTYDAAREDEDTLCMAYRKETTTEPTENGWKSNDAYVMTMRQDDQTFNLESKTESEMTFSPFHWEMTMVESYAGEKILQGYYVGEACEPFAMEEELTPLDIASLSTDDEAALQDALENGMKTTALLLFKQLPADMIRTYMDMIPLLLDMD